MQELLIRLGVFIAFHILPAIGPLRRFLVKALGSRIYTVLYSALSVALLVWVGDAYIHADSELLWPMWAWTRWVPAVAMVPACVLLVGSLTHSNPLSVGVKADIFDPRRPGIVSVTRHPLMWAFVLWAFAHMAPNGDSTSVVMFGFFVLLGLAGPKILDAKKRRQLGAEKWTEWAAATSNIPFWAALRGRTKIDWKPIIWGPGIGGLVLYVILMGAHPFIIGLSPLP